MLNYSAIFKPVFSADINQKMTIENRENISISNAPDHHRHIFSRKGATFEFPRNVDIVNDEFIIFLSLSEPKNPYRKPRGTFEFVR
jgi:hypothetical protein